MPIASEAQATPFTVSNALSCHRYAIPVSSPVPIQDAIKS